MAEVCRSCKRPIRWAVTPKGRPIPLDPEPVEDGNLELRERGSGLPPEARHSESQPNSQLAYKAHFATCAYADQHRKR